jgi:glutamate racemase
MTDARPIGLFDSGVGGLSVWREVVRLLPNESTVYFGDSANCPYGDKAAGKVKELSSAATRFLQENDCKLIIVACNTASAAALEGLRTEFDLPFVGMEPALKPAAEATRSGSIGVLATEGTFSGSLFRNTAERHATEVDVHLRVGAGLVEAVEAGEIETPETERLLRTYLEPMLAARVDQIALGCTHYPLLLPVIDRIVAGRAEVIDPGPAIARQVQRVLASRELEAPPDAAPTYRFYTSGDPAPMQGLLAILGEAVGEVVVRA